MYIYDTCRFLNIGSSHPQLDMLAPYVVCKLMPKESAFGEK